MHVLAAAARARRHIATRAASSTAARRGLSLLLLPLLGACAHASAVPGAPRAASGSVPASGQLLHAPDGALRVQVVGAPGAGGSLVLSGAPVRMLAGARSQRGDTLIATAPFAVAVPAEAFSLRIDARPAARGGTTLARVEFATVNGVGELESVRVEGTRVTVSRAAAGQPLAVSGATRRVVTAAALSAARR